MPHERFVTIVIDEMKIQVDLIWDKYSGELIGFVDLAKSTNPISSPEYLSQMKFSSHRLK